VLPADVAFNGTCNRPGDTSCPLLPLVLEPLGYAEPASVGKWHLDNRLDASLTPTGRGFAFHEGYWLGEQDYFYHNRSGGYDWHVDLDTDRSVAGTYSTYLMANASERIIRNHAARHRGPSGEVDTPLFLYHAWQAMHSREKYEAVGAVRCISLRCICPYFTR